MLTRVDDGRAAPCSLHVSVLRIGACPRQIRDFRKTDTIKSGASTTGQEQDSLKANASNTSQFTDQTNPAGAWLLPPYNYAPGPL